MNDLSIFTQFEPKAPDKFKEGNNAVIYTRVSSADQEDNTSLASQKKHCENYAQRRALNVVAYFGGTYESAKTDDRKEFNRMLTFVKRSKNINYVIVYSYERFSRSGINGASIADDLLKSYGVMTMAVTQELDPTTPSGSFQQKILFLFGQMDNELRKDKVVTGMTELVTKGHWCWNVPRGYKDLNKGKAVERKIVPNEEGKLIKKAFEWKAYKQMPNAEISRKLKTLGANINERRLNDIFLNPFYCGLITSKIAPGQVFEGKHEPLVSKELFLAVNNIRQEQRVHKYEFDKDNENLPLKVFVKCDKCGHGMTGYLVKKKGLYYYKCRTKGCKVNRSAIAMHDKFKEKLSDYFIDKEEAEIIKVLLEEHMAIFFKSKIEEAKKLKFNLTEVKEKLDKIEERYAVGEIDRTLYEKFKPKYEKEAIEIEQELSGIGSYSSNLEKAVDFAVGLCANSLKMWSESTLLQKQTFQNLLFPEGIYYNHKNDRVRTNRVNSFFSLIPDITKVSKEQKKRGFEENLKTSALVIPTGFEPISSEPESEILSIELRDQNFISPSI